MLIVIPTARGVISLENFRSLIEDGARFIVVDDSEGTVVVNHPQFQTYNWTDQNRMLGNDVIAIPRRNGACRDFGLSRPCLPESYPGVSATLTTTDFGRSSSRWLGIGS